MDSAFITLLTSAGVAGVFCILFIMGVIYPKSVVDDLKAERDALKVQNAALQDRADTAVTAAQGARDVFAALQAGMVLGTQRHEDQRSAAMRELPPDLQGRGSV